VGRTKSSKKGQPVGGRPTCAHCAQLQRALDAAQVSDARGRRGLRYPLSTALTLLLADWFAPLEAAIGAYQQQQVVAQADVHNRRRCLFR